MVTIAGFVHLVTTGGASMARVAVGAFLGLAWGASLRAWMVALALEFGERPRFTWEGTFGAILLPAALMGAALGWAGVAAEPSSGRRWRWALLSPLLMVLGPVVFVQGFVPTLVTTGLGGGAIGVALIGMLGGYAFSGRGPRWTRWIFGFLTVALFAAGALWGLYSVVVRRSASETFLAFALLLLVAVLVAGIGASARLKPRGNGV